MIFQSSGADNFLDMSGRGARQNILDALRGAYNFGIMTFLVDVATQRSLGNFY